MPIFILSTTYMVILSDSNMNFETSKALFMEFTQSMTAGDRTELFQWLKEDRSSSLISLQNNPHLTGHWWSPKSRVAKSWQSCKCVSDLKETEENMVNIIILNMRFRLVIYDPMQIFCWRILICENTIFYIGFHEPAEPVLTSRLYV